MTNLYFIKCEKFVKIGHSTDVEGRFADLQTGNPFPLQLLAVIRDVPESLEGVFHRLCIAEHHNGEWFHMTRVMRKMILLIAHGARPTTPTDISILREFAPAKGFALGQNLVVDPERGIGGFDKAGLRVIGLRSRSA